MRENTRHSSPQKWPQDVYDKSSKQCTFQQVMRLVPLRSYLDPHGLPRRYFIITREGPHEPHINKDLEMWRYYSWSMKYQLLRTLPDYICSSISPSVHITIDTIREAILNLREVHISSRFPNASVKSFKHYDRCLEWTSRVNENKTWQAKAPISAAAFKTLY